MDAQTLQKIYDAYNSGVMTPQEASEYEADVAAGNISLPQGGALRDEGLVNAFQGVQQGGGGQPAQQIQDQQPVAQQQEIQEPVEVDPGIMEAYQNDYMTRDEKMEFEKDVKSGALTLPPGAEIGETKPPDAWDALKDMVTGSERRTPETDSLPEWTRMPEMNELSAASFKSAAGTMATGPEETVKVIQSNYPNTKVRQDDKGNYVLQSSIDGQEYIIPPGLALGDIPRVMGVLLAFTPVGRATTATGAAVGAGATQAGIEASQAALGGEFNPEQVPLAAAGGAVGQQVAKGLGAAAGAIKRGYQRFTRKVVQPQEAQATVETAKQAAKGGLGAQGETVAKQELARAAAPDEETLKAAQRLGVDDYLQPDHVSTNQSFIELSQAVKSIPGSQARAAEVEGLSQVAQRADKIITDIGGSKDLSLLSANVKTQLENIQSKLETGSGKLYDKVAAAVPPKTPAPANNLINYLKQEADNMGGIEKLDPMERKLLGDFSPKNISGIAKNKYKADVSKYDFEDLQSYSNMIRNSSADTLSKAEAEAAVLSQYPNKFVVLDGKEVVGAVSYEVDDAAKKIFIDHLGSLKPGNGQQIVGELIKQNPDYNIELVSSNVAKGFWDKMGFKPTGKGDLLERQATMEQPTYAFLDKTRKSLTAARVKKEGVFKDMETGMIKKLEKELLKDQQAAVESIGDSRTLSMFNAARKSVAVRKGIEDDMTALFGKELDKSMVNSLTTSTKGLAKGDADKFIKLLNSVPKNMRQEVAASGMVTAFGKNARDGLINFNSYSKWFRDLKGNSKAYQALAQNLPKGAIKQLDDLAKVSEGITRSSRERITTGRLNFMKEQLNNADSFISKLYDFGKRVGTGAIIETMGAPAGAPGVGMGMALTSAVMKNKTPMMKAVDNVITDPAFIDMVKRGTKASAKKLVVTPAWQRFIKYATPAAGQALDANWVYEEMHKKIDEVTK